MDFSRLNIWLTKHGTVFSLALLLLVFWAGPAFAAGGGMPWESSLDGIQKSLQGPVAKAIGIIAIIVTGLSFAFGEGGPVFKKGLGICLGLSIAFTAGSFVDKLGFAGGAIF